jgi:ABC-type lipoprotein release transport system permease subunit
VFLGRRILQSDQLRFSPFRMEISRVLRGLLYGVTPLDGLTIASVASLVAGVALVAVGVPAWRAARVDPVTALRAE